MQHKKPMAYLENQNFVHVVKLFDDLANHIANVPVETSATSTSFDDPDNPHTKHGITTELEHRHRSARA